VNFYCLYYLENAQSNISTQKLTLSYTTSVSSHFINRKTWWWVLKNYVITDYESGLGLDSHVLNKMMSRTESLLSQGQHMLCGYTGHSESPIMW